MKIGSVIDDVSPTDSLNRAVLLDKLGFDSLWFSDHLIDAGGVKVDPWTTMGAISASTKRIKMCAAVSDTQRVHPAKLAHMVATLADLSDGRVWLGIGAGEAMNILPFGMPFDEPKARVERLAEAIQVVKLLWRSSRSRPVSFGGAHFRLQNAWMDLRVKAAPRVYVGALGGRMALEVAGKYGDGWISWINTPETFRERLEVARSASSSPKKLEACVWVYTVLSRDEADVKAVLNRAKRGLLAEAHTLKKLGFVRPAGLGRPYQNMLVSERSGELIRKSQDTVPDELVSRFVAAGSPSQIIERLEEFRKAGATCAMVHFVKEGDDQIRQFASRVLPHFA